MVDSSDSKAQELIDTATIRILDDMLWYYGKVQNTSKLSDMMWASRIMSLHYFRTEEEKQSQKQSRKYS